MHLLFVRLHLVHFSIFPFTVTISFIDFDTLPVQIHGFEIRQNQITKNMWIAAHYLVMQSVHDCPAK